MKETNKKQRKQKGYLCIKVANRLKSKENK